MIVKKIVINIILAFIIGLILFGFNFSFHSMKIIFYLVAFFLVCSVIKWMKYNHFNIIITLMVFISACTLFLLSVLYDLIIIRFFFILLCLSSLLLINKVTVNWGKYFDDILYAEKVDSAGRHMNIAEMTQITNDNMAKGNNIFKIYSMPINKKNSLMCKIIIETWRSGKKLFIFLAIMLISAIVLAKLPIISENSLLGMYHISTMVSSLLISGFFVNIIKLYQNHFQSFVDKHRKGFFVPFSHNKIMFSYLLICVLNVTVISLLLCIILSSGLIKGIIVVISFNIATFLLFILMKNKRLKKIESFVTIMINIILAFGATGLF